jgi:hypothetical protein
MLALAYVDDRLFEANIDGGPVAWLHDEFVLEVRQDQAELAAEILKQSMIDGFAETFPGAPLNGLVEPHIGLNWGEAKAGETAANAKPEPNLFAVFTERFELLRPDAGEEEAKARAYDFTVDVCRARYGGTRQRPSRSSTGSGPSSRARRRGRVAQRAAPASPRRPPAAHQGRGGQGGHRALLN